MRYVVVLTLFSPVRIFVILFLFLISLWIFVIISDWAKNEEKCANIKIQNAKVADDYEWTLNTNDLSVDPKYLFFTF